MADVTATFAAKDESFKSTVDKLENRLSTFQGGIDGFNTKAESIGAAFTKIGVAITAVVTAFAAIQRAIGSFQQSLEKVDYLNDFANRVDELPGNLALLETAFENGGSSADLLETAINKLNVEIGKAIDGSQESAKKFDDLGLSFNDLAGKSPTEMLVEVGKAIGKLPTPAEQTAEAVGLFGRNGASLVNVLPDLTEELDKAKQQLGSYPDILNRSAEKMGALNDNIKQVQQKLDQFTTGALSALEPLLSDIADAASKIDFADLGQNLGNALQDAIDTWIGTLDQSGYEIAESLMGNMKDSIIVVADFLVEKLINAFVDAVDFFADLFDSGAVVDALDYVANALINAVADFGIEMLDLIQNTIAPALDTFFASSASDLQNDFSKAFGKVLEALSSDFVEFLSNPITFVTDEFGKALTKTATSTAEDFKDGYNSSFGNVIDGLKQGLLPVVTKTNENMTQASNNFQSKVTAAANNAAEKSNELKFDFFDSEKAADRIKNRIEEARQSGASIRADISAASNSSDSVSLDLNTSSEDATKLEESFDEAQESAKVAQLKTSDMKQDGQSFANSVKTAKGDIKTSVDLMVGPNGLTERFNQAMDRVSDLKDVIDLLETVNRDDEHMRQAERRMDAAARRYDRDMDKANDQERRGNWNTSDNMRRQAEDNFQRSIREAEYEMHSLELRDREYQRAEEKLSLKDRLEAQRQADKDHQQRMREMHDRLNKEDQETADRIKQKQGEAAQNFFGRASDAANAVKQGADDAANALRNAVQSLGGTNNQALALEATLQQCREFLKNIDEKLPQHALT